MLIEGISIDDELEEKTEIISKIKDSEVQRKFELDTEFAFKDRFK